LAEKSWPNHGRYPQQKLGAAPKRKARQKAKKLISDAWKNPGNDTKMAGKVGP